MFRHYLLAALVVLSATLSAADVAATLIRVSGKGHVLLPGGASGEFRSGIMLKPGSRIVTEETGLAALLMGDGSRVNLGPNTDLLLAVSSQEGEARSTVFQLFKGLFRASVEKLTLGSVFQVKTDDAVAAVKGTEFEVEVGEEGTDARVKEGTVWLENEKGEKAVITQSMTARAERHGQLREVREMKREELERFGRWAAMSLPGKTDAEAARDRAFWDRLRPAQQQKLLAAFRQGLGDEAWDDITKLRNEERQERWKSRLRASDERRLASEESQVDFALRKTSIDIQGRRVRFEEYLLRPSADQIQFLNYTRREGRTDFLSSLRTYNSALPQQLSLAKGINQKAWDQVQAPQYWAVADLLVMGNDKGDSFAAQSTFFDPVAVAFSRWELPVNTREVRLNLPDVRVFAGGELVESWKRTNAGSALTTVVNNRTISAAEAISSNLTWNSSAPLASASVPVYRLLTLAELGAVPGDFAGGVAITYGNGRTVQLRSYGIDESGKVLNLGDLLANRSPLDVLSTLAFRSLSEVQLSSNGFNSDIDVVSKLLWMGNLSRTNDSL